MMQPAGRQRIYMDNAATSFPKPQAVHDAMLRYGLEIGASPGRGAYAEAKAAGEILHTCRERLNCLINGESPEHVIFTLNTTDALNLGIKGMLSPGDHVITTWMDHNSVLRPFNELAARSDIKQTRVACDPVTGLVNPDDIAAEIRPNTKLVAVVHGSNVTGTVQDVAAIGATCREADVPLLVDAAQTVGHMPLDVQQMGIDLLAFPGHKGLLGPLGTGALYIRPGMEETLRTLREGGTGSVSERDTQPHTLPDKYEPGSHNTVGIAGLAEAVDFLLERGMETVWRHERELMKTMLDGLREIEPLRLLGVDGMDNRCAVFAVVLPGLSSYELSDLLEKKYGVLTRPGLHCAPLAHQTMRTHPDQEGSGATRFSFGMFNTVEQVQHALGALEQLAAEALQPARP
jgi:cysteine desulfurase family protein